MTPRYVVIREGVHHYRVDHERHMLCGLRVMTKHRTYDYPPRDTRPCGSCRRHPNARLFR